MMTMKIKEFFFDRESVIKAAGKARVKVLSKIGAFVRKRAQTSMRYRKKAAAAGAPPSAHKESGALMRKLLYFGYDPSSNSVVVGPVSARGGEAPNLNEFGGRAKRYRRGVKQPFIATYPARPFMLPALKAEEPKMPKAWTNSIRGDV